MKLYYSVAKILNPSHKNLTKGNEESRTLF